MTENENIRTFSFYRSFEEVINCCINMPGIDSAGIYILDTGNRKLELVAHSGFGEKFIDSVKSYNGTSMQYAMVIEGKSVYMSFKDPRAASVKAISDEKIKVLGIIPIKAEGNIAGVLNVATHIHDDIPESIRQAAEAAAGELGKKLLIPGLNS